MTVLVTGASGHVGANLVRALLDRGDVVRCLIHDGSRALDGLDIERVTGDVTRAESLTAALEGVELVFHLAAVISIDGSQGGQVEAVNVEGVRNVATAALAAGVRRFVHCCSVHAFDQAPLGEPLDERRSRALGPANNTYDRSKAHGEVAVRELVADGLDAVIVHPTGIIGPYDFGPSRMGQVLIDLHRRSLLGLIEGGFDWVDVRDVVAGLLAAAARGRTGESYLLSGHWRSIGEVAATALDVTGVPSPRFVCPMWLARVGAPFVTGFHRVFGGEPLFTSESLNALRANRRILWDKAGEELGYAPRPFADTLRDTYAWFHEAGVLTLARPVVAEQFSGASPRYRA
jgi:dihydroflavonol-4-reductase